MTVFPLGNEAATEALGQHLAGLATSGDLVLLRGNLGMGKTTLARAFIRERAGEELDVPSPTFSLVESYPFIPPVHHVDLYRLDGAEQIVELGLDDLYDEGIVLIEWPERAEETLPMTGLEIAITESPEGGRSAVLTARDEGWAQRLGSLSEKGLR